MLELSKIEDAARRLKEIARTPCGVPTTRPGGLSHPPEVRERQYTASFKERGACNKLLLLTEEERARGVIATSAGNHAQGVAYHAQRMGIHAEIVMPRFTPHGEGGSHARLVPKWFSMARYWKRRAHTLLSWPSCLIMSNGCSNAFSTTAPVNLSRSS